MRRVGWSVVGVGAGSRGGGRQRYGRTIKGRLPVSGVSRCRGDDQ